jgi:hypothetical protein
VADATAETEHRRDRAPPAAETLDQWRHEVRAMKTLVGLWEACRQGDKEALSERVKWIVAEKNQVSVTYEGPHVWPFSKRPKVIPGSRKTPPPTHGKHPEIELTIASQEFRPDWLRQFVPGDVLGPALFFVLDQVNQRLAELTRPRLVHDPQTPHPQLVIVPRTLLGVLWLQFAQAIASNTTFRDCKVCGRAFDVSSPGHRTTRIYCSDACKNQAYLQAKEGLDPATWMAKGINFLDQTIKRRSRRKKEK